MVRVRPLEADDLELLAPIDATEAACRQREPVATRAALTFYARTGHAFVAESDGAVRGFALAQAVWDGARPTVRLRTLATSDARDDEARAALLEAVTKSAYDAAVYDLVAELPDDDAPARALLLRSSWRPEPIATFRRTLGSRGAPR